MYQYWWFVYDFRWLIVTFIFVCFVSKLTYDPVNRIETNRNGFVACLMSGTVCVTSSSVESKHNCLWTFQISYEMWFTRIHGWKLWNDHISFFSWTFTCFFHAFQFEQTELNWTELIRFSVNPIISILYWVKFLALSIFVRKWRWVVALVDKAHMLNRNTFSVSKERNTKQNYSIFFLHVTIPSVCFYQLLYTRSQITSRPEKPQKIEC